MQHEINSFVLVEKREASVFVGGRCRNLAKILIVRADRIGSAGQDVTNEIGGLSSR